MTDRKCKHRHKHRSHRMTSTDPDGPLLTSSAPSRESVGAAGPVPKTMAPKKQDADSPTTPITAAAAARYRAGSRPSGPQPPTLLVDFLRGRPSPARVTAQRQRKTSVDAIKAEIRQEMRQNSVRRLQPPGGVKDRVKAWQKANAAAMVWGDPVAAPSEPSEIAFRDEIISVTEDDRLRVRMRKRSATAPKEPTTKSTDLSGSSGTQPGTAGTTETPETSTPKKTPPKKRVVSDDHWMDKKNKKKSSPPRPANAPKRKPQPDPVPLPKDFLQRTARTQPPSQRVRAWAKGVENMPPDDSPGGVRQKARADKSGDFDEDVDSLIYNESNPAYSHASSTTRSPRKSAKSDTELDDDGIRVAPIRVKERRKQKPKVEPEKEAHSTPSNITDPSDDGIRVAPIGDKEKGRKSAKAKPDRGTFSVPSSITDPSDDGIRVRPMQKTPAGDKGPDRKCSHQKQQRKPTRNEPSVVSGLSLHDASPYDYVYDREDGKDYEESDHDPQTPTRRAMPRSKPRMGHRPRATAPTEITTTTQTTDLTESTETTGTTDEEAHLTMRGARSPGRSSLESSCVLNDGPTDQASLAEIPFGKSAFSELGLPLGADSQANAAKRKPQRNPSFSAAKVLKRVVSEGRKMMHESAPPRAPANNPPSIENWLTHTVDPFLDEPTGSEQNPAQTRKSVEKRWAEENQARQPPKEATPRKESQAQQPAKERTPGRENEARQSPKEATPKKESQVRQPTKETAPRREDQARQSPKETTLRKTSTPQKSPPVDKDEKDPTPKATKGGAKPKEEVKKTPPSTGLKRKGATRAAASPMKPGAGRSFRDAFKDAFKGQSTNQIFNHTSYESREEREYKADSGDEYYYDDIYPPPRSMGSHQRSFSPDSYDSRDYDDDQTTTTSSLPEIRRRPPTNGVHELSTIISEGSGASYSSYDSYDSYASYDTYGDTMSTLSHTTVTQTTALTRESELSRQSSRKSGSGLKRRLTKHSDLVSVLSAPENASLPRSVRNSRSRPSVRRTGSKRGSVTVDDLMQEFEDDESLYSRELKTLVDGVVPVLLNYAGSESADHLSVFGANSPGKKVDALSKAVVGMGISLEKLKNAHRKAPSSDIHSLMSWLRSVVPIYSGYLDAWRGGFDNLVVNLAPADDIPEDDDSLLNALPRNDDGDIIDDDGERVDVAHLLKRPIFRIKMLNNLVKSAHAILNMESTQALVYSFAALQDHARRRHKEERARATDEDAANTDTTRTRDLRTLAALDYVRIDPGLQVNAKDHFMLSVSHSNGQRMECQVELVHRDKLSVPSHPGDLLIRQIGDGRRSWLLFPPMPLTLLSARRGDLPDELVVMMRGTHNGRQWCEIVRLLTDDKLQISEWLEILGTDPVPPLATDMQAATPEPESPQRLEDVPVGGRSVVGSSSPDRGSPPAPVPRTSRSSRYHPRSRGLSPVPEPGESTLDAQSAAEAMGHEMPGPPVPQIEVVEAESSQGLTETCNSKPYREDGAPPPPVHRTFPSKNKTHHLQLPADTQVKRRGSSPLKHEYLPSETSESELTEDSESQSETESESDSDEIDSIDIPDTEIGFSIIEEEDGEDEQEVTGPRSVGPEDAQPPIPDAARSDVSITPSNSASQVGVGAKLPGPTSPPEDASRFICSVSHWSDKRGSWKELSKDLCTVIVSAGRMETFAMKATRGDKPLVALDLTPLVLIRKSNALDFEVRTALMEHSKLLSMGGGTFRFRNGTQEECLALYAAVHDARLKNEKYIKLENEARFKSFGERRPGTDGDEGSGSGRRRSWLGRRNSYRASARAPARSAEEASTATSTASASSFLRRLTGGANLSFNIGRSSVEKQNQSRAGSFSFSGSSSGEGSMPRSPSVSIGDGGRGIMGPDNVPIRLHLLVSASKWEDYGNCRLQVRRPPEGWRQELRANHGLEKRITVSTVPKKKDTEGPRVILDAVLGSGCFGSMGTRGIVCSVWEEMRDEFGNAGVIPRQGAPGGNVKKWCFQLGGVGNAGWLLALLHEEVVRA